LGHRKICGNRDNNGSGKRGEIEEVETHEKQLSQFNATVVEVQAYIRLDFLENLGKAA